MTCTTCKIYEEVIDELSDLLSKSQRFRRRVTDENRKLLALIIMDMENEHNSTAITQADGYVE